MHIKLTAGNECVTQTGVSRACFGSANRKVGPWAKWDWNGTALDVRVDRYGMYPLFWAALPEGIAISDSIASLLQLGASRELDDRAIAAFLRLGFFLGEDTPFRDVHAFPPQGHLRWSREEGWAIKGALWPRVIDSSMSRKEAVSGFVDRFRTAVRNSLPAEPTRTVLPLSGGRDSRHIALELHRLGFQPGLVLTQHHFAARRDDDFEVAAALSTRLGWPIEIVAQAKDPVASETEKNKIFDCTTDEHAWFLPASSRINALKPLAVFDGIAGDALSNGLFIRDSWVGCDQPERLADWLCDESRRGYGAHEQALKALLSDRWAKRLTRDVAISRVTEEFDKHRFDENPLNSLFFWNRTRREIAPFLIRYIPGVEVITPYLDRDVFDFLWSLPSRYFSDHSFHDDAIAHAAPKFAHIPYAKGGAHNETAHTVSLMRGMARKLTFWRNGEILNHGWLRPRLAGSLVSHRIAGEAHWYASWAIWLTCLEQLIDD